MRSETTTSSNRGAIDSERAYLARLGAAPRFDREREAELGRAVVRARRAYWTVLLSPARLPAVLGVIAERGHERTIVELAAELRAELERDGAGEATARELEALAEALDRRGDEHAAADAIVALAARTDARWHADVLRARTAFLTARNRFVSLNLRLVITYANRYGAQLMPLVDRIQEGNIGLVKAVDRFDPERGIRFSTYACWWIRHTILRALTNDGRTVRVPSQTQALHTKAERARRRLRTELGREPERAEVAAAIGCTAKQLDAVSLAMQLHNVVSHAGPEGEHDVFDTIDDEAALAAIERAGDQREQQRALAALAELPPRVQEMLHERYGFVETSLGTYREVGLRHGVSRERARQIHAGALTQLRRKLDPRPKLLPLR